MSNVFENIPAELKKNGLFCVWNKEEQGGRKTKVPYNPVTGQHARTDDPATFAPYAQAQEALRRRGYDGIAMLVTGDLAAIDIDHCIVDGQISDMAQDILDTMDCYAERSPSGEGIRILFLAKNFEYDKERYYINNQRLGLEIYIAGATHKCVTLTGDTIQMYHRVALEERGEAVAMVMERYMVRPATQRVPAALPSGGGSILSDADVIDKAQASRTSAQFLRLWQGDWSDYNSQSEADLALCNILAFWSGRDADQMDRLYRQSGLMREKWDRPQSGSTYGAITIQRAIGGCHNVYEAPPSRPAGATGTVPIPGGLVFPPAPTEQLPPPPDDWDDELPPPPPEEEPPAEERGPSAPAEGDKKAIKKWHIPENIPKLTPISARSLQDKDLPPLRWVVLGLLPEGLAMLASPPKYGKSWMVLDIAISVASGQSFLGRSIQSGRVLYLALEDGKRRLKERTNKLMASEDAPANLDLQIQARSLDEGLLEQLHQYMLDNPDTVLIIIDTFAKVRSKRSADNSYLNDYREMGQLKRFADYHHICLLCVHHLRKMRDESDPFNQISGTNGILGALDTAMVLTRSKRDDGVTILNVTGRDLDGYEELLRFDKISCHWHTEGDASEYKAQEERQEYEYNPLVVAVQRIVADNPYGWVGTASDLMDECIKRVGMYPEASAKSYVPALKRLRGQLHQIDGIRVDVSGRRGHQALIRIWGSGDLPFLSDDKPNNHNLS